MQTSYFLPEPPHCLKAVLIRCFEEKLLELYAAGELFGTVHTCIGQEWVGVALAAACQKEDVFLSNHRGHGHFLAKLGDYEGLLAEVMGRRTGICGGIGGSQHLFAENFLSNGVQGGMVPVATGIALARKLLGKSDIVVVFIGDGTFGEGVIYESFNIASKWGVPVLVVVENNGIAQSTLTTETMAGTVEGRAKAFDLEFFSADTWRLKELFSVAQKAVDFVRGEKKAAILEITTYRLKAHSKGDDTREKAIVDEFLEKDILTQFLREDEGRAMHLAVRSKIDEAVEKIRSHGFLSAKELPTHRGLTQEKPIEWKPIRIKEDQRRFVSQLNQVFQDLYHKDDRTLFLGEDLRSPYGGAFKVTKDVGVAYGMHRIFNTPISEAAVVGIATGLALEGFRPIVEIMFGDFLTLTFDQLFSHAAKFHFMSNGKVDVPLIVRAPMGGYRGYGPTHSQSIEKHFLGIPFLDVIALNKFVQPEKIYSHILATSTSPTLVIENKLLYSEFCHAESLVGYEVLLSNESFPSIQVVPKEKHAEFLILCYGGALNFALQSLEILFDEHECFGKIFCPSLISSVNTEALLASIGQTRKIILLEEGVGHFGWGSEMSAVLYDKLRGVKIARVFSENFLPTSKNIEVELLPSVEKIIQTALQMEMAL